MFQTGQSTSRAPCLALWPAAIDIGIKELKAIIDDDVTMEVSCMCHKPFHTAAASLDVVAPCAGTVVMVARQIDAPVVGA
jgi:hypothetical protein